MAVYLDQIVLEQREMEVALQALKSLRAQYEIVSSYGSNEFVDILFDIRALEQKIDHRLLAIDEANKTNYVW